MSNTSAALSNARAMSVNKQRARRWLERAAENFPHDIVLPGHIVLRVNPDLNPGLWIQCKRCDKGTGVQSVSQAADFRDHHYHCGMTHVDAWRCPTCDHWEFHFQYICRFCHPVRDEGIPTGLVPVTEVLDQYLEYDVFQIGRRWRASVKCNSLLRAKRAARAMYPNDAVEVRCAFGSWDSGA